jgi:hypothetical protein
MSDGRSNTTTSSAHVDKTAFITSVDGANAAKVHVDAPHELPRAIKMGEIHIAGVIIPCAVLPGPRRVLTQQGFLRAIGRARSAKGGQGASIAGLPAFLAAKNLRPYISPELEQAATPIVFRTLTGGQAFGYQAELLPLACTVYLEARDAGKLHRKQYPIVTMCDILIRGLASVGIVALVDEATGYQQDRTRDALEQILSKFISKELAKWVRTFPPEFYEELFRLRGLRYSDVSTKRPVVIARLTNDIVYERLAPGVLDELKRITPKDDKGRRKHKYFQRLTEDVGHPKLREHLSNAITLMKASPNYPTFYRLLQRALPKYKDQMQMKLPIEDQDDFALDED